ncbi:MAG: hypothetical protein IT172_04465 [Acidobacteria bacterium]|nr:hypothetical protein [Acidobacteriota bacterium]MCO5333379.1 hypothetical protein [Pyrinomonadaceae bacterium]
MLRDQIGTDLAIIRHSAICQIADPGMSVGLVIPDGALTRQMHGCATS